MVFQRAKFIFASAASKDSASRVENKINSFIFYPEAQPILGDSQSSASRVENKIGDYIEFHTDYQYFHYMFMKSLARSFICYPHGMHFIHATCDLTQINSLITKNLIGAFCCWPPACHKLCLCFTRPKAAKLADNKTQVLSFRSLCEESLIQIFPPFSRQNDKVVWFRI